MRNEPQNKTSSEPRLTEGEVKGYRMVCFLSFSFAIIFMIWNDSNTLPSTWTYESSGVDAQRPSYNTPGVTGPGMSPLEALDTANGIYDSLSRQHYRRMEWKRKFDEAHSGPPSTWPSNPSPY